MFLTTSAVHHVNEIFGVAVNVVRDGSCLPSGGKCVIRNKKAGTNTTWNDFKFGVLYFVFGFVVNKFVLMHSVTVDISLLWPRRLSSALGNSEVRCEVVNYICRLANHIANVETKLATSLPTKLINPEVSFFSAKANQFLPVIGFV